MSEYGPFHRIKSPTQTHDTAIKQRQSSEIWGRPIANVGLYPKVKAYMLPLCEGEPTHTQCADEQGIEFTTFVKPASKAPSGLVYWDNASRPVEGIRIVNEETIALKATIYKIVYDETSGLG